jgi:hypothetical protein
MLIKASKIRLLLCSLMVIFIITFSLISLIPSSLSSGELLLISVIFSVLSSTLFSICSNLDVEIVENELMIGGAGIYNDKKLSLFQRFKRRQYVTRETIDIVRSKKRNIIDSLFGIHRVYDKNGRGFTIYRYYFTKKKLNIIFNKLDDILNLKIL